MKAKIMLILVLLFLSGPVITSFAASASAGMPWETPLEKIQNSLTGYVPIVIGVIIIAMGGIGLAFTGGQGLGKLFWAVVGIGIAVNAASLVANIIGSGTGMLI